MRGRVTSFQVDKYYGFIKGDDGEDYFVHLNDVDGRQALARHQLVSFEATATPKGPRARSVAPGPMPQQVPEYPRRFISTEKLEVPGFFVARFIQHCWYEARDPRQARAGLEHRAWQSGANAIIGRTLHKYSKRRNLANHRYTMHRFSGQAVILQKDH